MYKGPEARLCPKYWKNHKDLPVARAEAVRGKVDSRQEVRTGT
jgi:hypothetical protein